MNNNMGFQVNILHTMHVSDPIYVFLICYQQTRSQLSVSTVKNTHEIKTRGEGLRRLKQDSLEVCISPKAGEVDLCTSYWPLTLPLPQPTIKTTGALVFIDYCSPQLLQELRILFFPPVLCCQTWFMILESMAFKAPGSENHYYCEDFRCSVVSQCVGQKALLIQPPLEKASFAEYLQLQGQLH